VLAAVAAASAGEAREEGEPGRAPELVVVPRGGGVFVEEGWWESCHMMMVGGGGWVPLRAERRPAPGLVLYRPVRPLVAGVVYRVAAMRSSVPDDEAACGTFGRAVAGAAVDRRPPRWWLGPRVEWTGYRSGCVMDDALVDFALSVEDESPVRLVIEARPRDGVGGAMRAVVRPSDGRAHVEWPTRGDGEGVLRAGVEYVATVCAEDAAGNRSCARSATVFTAPGPEQEEVATEPPAPGPGLGRAVRTATPEQQAGVGLLPAPDERMEPARVLVARVDWWWAGAGAAGALVFVAVVALARGRGYWSWWTRM
jgi:hypothetical protein